MDWVVLEGVKPYDGRYEFDLTGNELTTREWGQIKRLTGYLPLTIEKGFEGADPELFAAFATLMLARAGKIGATDIQAVYDRICDAPFGTTVRLESDTTDEQEEADASPPASLNGNKSSSGAGSTPSSATSTDLPSGFGIHVSASSPSVPTRSVT